MNAIRILPSTATEEEWLAARRRGIGASEIAAAVGLSRRCGPWDVWSSKVYGTDWEPTDEMRWGQFIESRIVDWWARETGRHVGQGGLYRHPQHEWLLATPDAVVVEPPSVGAVGTARELVGRGDVLGMQQHVLQNMVTATVDAKNAGWHMAGDWTDDGAPLEYICQITHQMLAVGVRVGYLVAVVGGKPPTERRFELDDDFARDLIKQGSEFWQLVKERRPPPLDGSWSAARWVSARYPDADPYNVAELDGADFERLAEIVSLDERIDALTAIREGLRTQIKSKLGTASSGVYNGREMVTWKTVNRTGYEVKASTYRKLTIPKGIREELSHGHRS